MSELTTLNAGIPPNYLSKAPCISMIISSMPLDHRSCLVFASLIPPNWTFSGDYISITRPPPPRPALPGSITVGREVIDSSMGHVVASPLGRPCPMGTVAVLHFCNWGGSRGGVGCDRDGTKSFNPLTPIVAIWVNPVPEWVKPSFVIFDIRALCRLKLSVRVLGCQKLQMTA